VKIGCDLVEVQRKICIYILLGAFVLAPDLRYLFGVCFGFRQRSSSQGFQDSIFFLCFVPVSNYA
jgi:hypothetical protein